MDLDKKKHVVKEGAGRKAAKARTDRGDYQADHGKLNPDQHKGKHQDKPKK